MKYHTALAILSGVLLLAAPALAEEICTYKDRDGRFYQTKSAELVPKKYRRKARCVETGNVRLARPGDIELSGSERVERMNSGLGEIELRWARAAERDFGRSPIRATGMAARTVSSVLRKAVFPARARKLELDWKIVFMDGDLPEAQIPSHLLENCHPGWMTPPANIYIVGQRVAHGCWPTPKREKKAVADSRLAEVLVHEMGHAVEHYLLDGRLPPNRMRSEGFATWFEIYAAKLSSDLSEQELRRRVTTLAKRSIEKNPNSFHFSGSAEDYARAGMYFVTIERVRGIRALLDVYETMYEDRTPFFRAIRKRLGWNQRRLNQEVARLLGL